MKGETFGRGKKLGLFVNRSPVGFLVEMYPLYIMTSQFNSNSVAFVTLLSSGRNKTFWSFGSYQQVVMIYCNIHTTNS